jgi:mono/diheme cytochrome c family protein
MEEGRKIFIGETNPDVNCASCHGKDGKPVKAGARDFRNGERMKLYSDAVWFWRISEGVPNTKMKAWKTKLSEEDRWKLMLWERNFGLAGKGWDAAKSAWVPAGEMGGGAPAAAPASAPAAPAAPAPAGK